MKELLDNFLETKKVPHALLFAGRDLLYLKKQAYLFASKIILSDLYNSHTENQKSKELFRLNIYEYSPKGKLELHSIDTIRQLISEAWKPNFNAISKVFIIYSADRMLPSAASALLKIFEEPQNNVFIFLVSSKIEKLTPPILSRSVIVSFNQQDSLIYSEILTELFDLMRKGLFVFSSSDIATFYQKIEAIFKKKEVENDLDILKQEVKNILNVIYLCFRDKFILDEGISKKLLSFPKNIEVTSQMSPIPLGKVHHIIQYAAEALEKATNKQFVLEWVFLQIEKLSNFYALN